MDWSKGYSSSCYVMTVDPKSWRDVERMEIYGGSVSRADGDLGESAQINCAGYDQSAEKWVRIYFDTEQNGAAAHNAVFTGIATSPTREINGRLSTNNMECYSVLKPAADVLLPRGWYAPSGANGAALIKSLLSATPAPKATAEDSPILTTSIIAEDGESNLTMTQKILSAIGWRIRIEGDGTINVEPQPKEVSVTFDCLDYDAIEPVLSVGYDWFSCPNVLRVTRSGISATAKDEDPDSAFSIASRGREIWAAEKDVSLANHESLQSYARRRLKELQNVVYSASYDRRYHPDIFIGDLVRIHYPEQNIDGVFKVKSQMVDLATGRTSEEGEKHE